MSRWDRYKSFFFPAAPEFSRVSRLRARMLSGLSLFLAFVLSFPLALSGVMHGDWFNVWIDVLAGLAYVWVSGTLKRNQRSHIGELTFLTISLMYFFLACYVEGIGAFFYAPLGMVFVYLVFQPGKALACALVAYAIGLHIGMLGLEPINNYNLIRLVLSGILMISICHTISCLSIQSVGKFNRLIQLLRERNRSLLEAHSTQKVFLRSISHEFRTPLHAVIAGLHSLNASGLDVMQSKIASDIEESCKTLDDLLFKIIDLNEAETGQLQTLNEPFELNRLLNRLVALLEGLAHQYNLDLSVDMSNDIPELAMGDKNRLQQALEELTVNIVKLLRNGQLRCRIFARFTFAQQFLLVIDLADTGEPKVTSTLRVLREAFEKIRKSNSLGSVSRRDVGLSLAFRLIKLMNGHVISEEQINRRSNVTLELPLRIAHRQEDALPEDIPKLVPKARLKDRRILVVDDNLINLEVGREMFLTAHAEVDMALGGEEAYKMIDRADPPYDLILLDIHMPGMDGYTLARALRSSMRHRKLKIIGYTASQLYSDREAALRAGMDEVFVKGGEPHRLISLCASQIESGLAA